jgi:hypothetical protein
MDRGIRLPQAFQDGACRPQDTVSRTRVPRDPLDSRHAKIRQDLRDVAHQDHQPPSLGNVLHFGLLEVPLKLGKLHQLLMVVPGVEAL